MVNIFQEIPIKCVVSISFDDIAQLVGERPQPEQCSKGRGHEDLEKYH